MIKTIYKKDSSGKIRFLEISAKEGTVEGEIVNEQIIRKSNDN